MNKSLKKVLETLVLSATLMGCSSPEKNLFKSDANSKPYWVKHDGEVLFRGKMIYGIGSYEGSKLYLSRDGAEKKARANISIGAKRRLLSRSVRYCNPLAEWKETSSNRVYSLVGCQYKD